MRSALRTMCAVVLLSMLNGSSFAAEPAHDPAAATVHAGGETPAAAAARPDAQPVLPESSAMGGSMIIMIAGLFLAAAIVGPVVRYHAPEEAPEVSHDEHGHAAHGALGHGHDAHGAHGHGH